MTDAFSPTGRIRTRSFWKFRRGVPEWVRDHVCGGSGRTATVASPNDGKVDNPPLLFEFELDEKAATTSHQGRSNWLSDRVQERTGNVPATSNYFRRAQFGESWGQSIRAWATCVLDFGSFV